MKIHSEETENWPQQIFWWFHNMMYMYIKSSVYLMNDLPGLFWLWVYLPFLSPLSLHNQHVVCVLLLSVYQSQQTLTSETQREKVSKQGKVAGWLTNEWTGTCTGMSRNPNHMYMYTVCTIYCDHILCIYMKDNNTTVTISESKKFRRDEVYTCMAWNETDFLQIPGCTFKSILSIMINKSDKCIQNRPRFGELLCPLSVPHTRHRSRSYPGRGCLPVQTGETPQIPRIVWREFPLHWHLASLETLPEKL